MELTKQHKVLIVIAGLGVCAVLVDRLFLAGPPPQAAAAALTFAPSLPVAAQPPAQDSTLLPQSDGAADRLARLAGEQPGPTPENEAMLRTAFGIPVVAQPSVGAEQTVASQAASQAAAQALAAPYKLSSVLDSGEGYAVVNGVMLAVGQADPKTGIRLVSINLGNPKESASAVIEHRGLQVRLSTGLGAAPIAGAGGN